MREEVFGLEDSFKFSTHVMSAFAVTELEGRDSSVELYLLNHWIRDFNLRDLIDRLSSASVSDERMFPVLFRWFMSYKLNGNSEEQWAIEDFRKVALFLSKNLKEKHVHNFF